jgi:outer membrane lipoprotein-sorting protein
MNRPAALALLALMAATPSSAATPLAEFADAWAKIDDYRCSIVVHETKGTSVQDRQYNFWFKKPTIAKLEITSGPGRGGGASWTCGDKVRGHQGGLLSGVKLTVSINDSRAVSLRGDTIDTASFAYILANLQNSAKGTVSEGPGLTIDGVATDAVALRVANPASNQNVTRDVTYISRTTHLPVRRERFEGETLVKQETFVDVKPNVGLKDSDF